MTATGNIRTKEWVGLLGVLLCTGIQIGFSTLAAASSDWEVVPYTETKVWVELPPLAKLEATDDSGATWKWRGKIPLNIEESRKDFALCLRRQGWFYDKTIVLRGKPAPHELVLFKKGNQSMIVMLFQAALGETRFSMGVDNDLPLERTSKGNKRG